jgi:hypothetical protein
VRTPDGFPFDVDLRVDDAIDPVGSLARLVDLQASRQLIIQARLTARRGNTAAARAMLAAGTARAHDWPRALVLAAEVATELEDPAQAVRDLAVAFAHHPGRRSLALGRGTFAALGRLPAFHRWIDADLRRGLRADELALLAAPEPTIAARLDLAARLLEAGQARAALDRLDSVTPADAEVLLLRAYAWQAIGRVGQARDACRAGLALAPGHPRLTRLVAVLDRIAVSAPRGAAPRVPLPPDH